MTNASSAIRRSLKARLGKPQAGYDSDPHFFSAIAALPNPDTILRNIGQAEKVYFSIMADAHVIGDVRSIRGSFRSHQYRVVAGNEDDPKSVAAKELCEQWMASAPPNAMADWLEVMWQMSSSILTGYRAHELVWQMQGGKYLPGQVIDRPNRRFLFSQTAEPLLISRGNMQGAPVEPYQFVISRHMADTTNPYGVALLSSCFWPWTFKTGGWRFFVKYCERHGLPWPVARYPMGTSQEEQDELEKALQNMLEASYVMAPEGTSLELLTPTTSSSGTLPQESLINLANREMSKALTGQAMVAELQGTGSRAASDTAQRRQDSINDSDRDIAASGMGFIFKWITLFNFGDGIAPPTLEFFQHEKAGKDRAETYQIAADMGARPSKSAMLEELDIPEAEDDADALMPSGQRTAKPAAPVDSEPATQIELMRSLAGFEFAKAAGMTDDEAVQLATEAAEQAIEDNMIAPVAAMLARFEGEGKTLAEFKAALEDLVGEMDDEGLREVLDRALSYSILRGAATQAA
jgi:phage gp29-like protein